MCQGMAKLDSLLLAVPTELVKNAHLFFQCRMNYDILIFNIAVFIAAVFLLEYGADEFIDHTAVVASRLGVSQTLVALLTAGAEWEEVR